MPDQPWDTLLASHRRACRRWQLVLLAGLAGTGGLWAYLWHTVPLIAHPLAATRRIAEGTLDEAGMQWLAGAAPMLCVMLACTLAGTLILCLGFVSAQRRLLDSVAAAAPCPTQA